MKEHTTEKVMIEINSELYEKYQYICRYYGHPFSIQIQSAIYLYINEFERVHGKIDLNGTQKVMFE